VKGLRRDLKSNARRRDKTMGIKQVFVVGAGLMGGGIAQVCAQSGMHVLLNDVSQEAVDKGLKNISWSVGKLVEKGKLSEQTETILNRITPCLDFSQARQADLAIEVVFEKLEVKKEIFAKLDASCKADALLASNTSAIPITEIAAVTKRPDKVVGLHFFSPASLMQAVEVVKGVSTSQESMQRGVDFVKALGKEPIRVESDMAGFLLNRINLVSYVEAIRLVEQGIGTVDDIGKDMRYYPPQLLRRKVKAGQLGRKTGTGWFQYNSDGTRKEG
jgi:3-hydroxybutyryl-CoA dehydrogenase